MNYAYFPAGFGGAKVSIFFKVSDSEGDIGFGAPNIYVVDSRFPADTTLYTTPNIPLSTSSKGSFTGLFETQIEGGFLLLRGDSLHTETDTLQFIISMNDKAGNRSNSITTTPLILFK